MFGYKINQSMNQIILKKHCLYVVLGFCRGVKEVLALLGRYAALIGSYLPALVTAYRPTPFSTQLLTQLLK
jgi:hypothetical protein